MNADDGQPVAGASIIVSGTTIGTYADANGKFSLTNVPANATQLEVSFLGMKAQTVKIAPYVSITLLAEANSINETVVVAYGTQKRESITGSVSQIDEKKLELRATTSATGALEGAAPGVQVNNTYGEPGAAPTIRIRGFGSVNGSNEPLFVVDGAPFEGNIAEINPADIASISVLKGCGVFRALRQPRRQRSRSRHHEERPWFDRPIHHCEDQPRCLHPWSSGI